MAGAIKQAKGSVSRVVVGFEEPDCFGIPPDAADRKPINMLFNSAEITLERALNESATIRGDRNPTEPFQGNSDVNGSIVVPIEDRLFGIWLKAAIGIPTTSEIPDPATEIGAGGTVAITSGSAVFSNPQVGSVVGDRVIFTEGGVTQYGFITAKVDDSNMTIKADLGGSADVTDVSAATVDFLVSNGISGTPTIDIVSGVGTISVSQTVNVGDQFIYDTNKFAYVTVVNSGTSVDLVDALGFTPADTGGAVDLEAIENRPSWKHIFIIDPTAELPSMDIELGFRDITPNIYHVYKGVKIDSMEISIGGDEELIATLNVIGADRDFSNTAFDATVPALVQSSKRFENFQASAKEGQPLVATNVLRAFDLTHNNNLDPESFVIGGGGIRVALPAGIAGVGGSLEALFVDDAILAKARDAQETSLEILIDNTESTLKFLFPEVIFQQNDPGIPGPEGLLLELDYQAFKDDSVEASAIHVEFINDQPAY